MTSLRDFIAARLDEDEATARAATPGPWEWDGYDREYRSRVSQRVTTGTELGDEVGSAGDRDARHIIRHNPARVLREVTAKRALLADFTDELRDAERHQDVDMIEAYTRLLGVLAAPYSDHPDYRKEWAA